MAAITSGNPKDGISINLYPMLDIFSILICFLLMNYSTQAESTSSATDLLELPRSEVRLSLDSAASVTITRKEIVAQGAVIIPIDNDGDVPEKYRFQGGVKEIYDVFAKVKNSNETLKNRDLSLNLQDKDLNTLTMEADKKTGFKLIKRVMLSAEQADFVSWKLAVQKEILD